MTLWGNDIHRRQRVDVPMAPVVTSTATRRLLYLIMSFLQTVLLLFIMLLEVESFTCYKLLLRIKESTQASVVDSNLLASESVLCKNSTVISAFTRWMLSAQLSTTVHHSTSTLPLLSYSVSNGSIGTWRKQKEG